MSEEKTRHDKLKELCDLMVDLYADAQPGSVGESALDTALTIFSEYENKLYDGLEQRKCYQCKKEITESDEHLIVEGGTANVFCSPECYANHSKEIH